MFGSAFVVGDGDSAFEDWARRGSGRWGGRGDRGRERKSGIEGADPGLAFPFEIDVQGVGLGGRRGGADPSLVYPCGIDV